ncbi:MAG: hypothetical protein J7L04_00950 [Bacteroidales bacterium]|nr:hypothetical protein [Bacteroidales bacterium]
MKYLMKLFILIFAVLACSMSAFAQGCEEPADDGGDTSFKPRIIGFIQPQYEYHFTKDDDRNIKNSNTFKFMRARLGVTGKIPYDFTYYAMMEFSPFVSKTGYPYLLDVFISYRRFKWASISAGSFKQPFGLEVNTPCSGLHTIYRSVVSDQLVSPQRDMGLMLFGGNKQTFVRYSAALMNGTGLGVKDNNNKKDIIGRAVIHPLDFLYVGGSFRQGWPTKDTLTRTSFAAEIEVQFSNFLFQAEYIFDEGDYNRSAGGGCGSDPLVLGEKRAGWWAMAMYRTYFNLEPVIKVESFDTGDDYGNSDLITTFGFNYFINDNVRLQVNYRYRAEKNDLSTAEIPNDALVFQLQAKF